jgi:hypothetical protein
MRTTIDMRKSKTEFLLMAAKIPAGTAKRIDRRKPMVARYNVFGKYSLIKSMEGTCRRKDIPKSSLAILPKKWRYWI